MLVTCSFGTINTGKTVYYTILEPDKSVYVSRRNTGVTELLSGSGVYGVDLEDAILLGRTITWNIDGTNKSASETFYTTSLDVSLVDWSDMWASMPTGTSVNVVAPVYLNGDVQIIRGDDYATPENRELSWTDTSNIWPDLTGASFQMTISHHGVVEATISSVSYATGVLTAQLFYEDTHKLTVGKSLFDIQATLVNGRKATLVLGTVTIIMDYTC
jgi:hypothetical protein